MPEVWKLHTLEKFQWQVNSSRRVPYERWDFGAFCFALTEVSHHRHFSPLEGVRAACQSSVLHQLQHAHSAGAVCDNGSRRMDLKWWTLRHCATILHYLIRHSGSNQRKALLKKHHFLVLVFSLLSPVLYFTQTYFIFSHKGLHCQKHVFSTSSNSGFIGSYTREENVSYSRLPMALLVSFPLAKGKTSSAQEQSTVLHVAETLWQTGSGHKLLVCLESIQKKKYSCVILVWRLNYLQV